jgi:hypothetical protein
MNISDIPAFFLQEERTMKNIDARQDHAPHARDKSVIEYCRKNGLSATEERKLVKLLGKYAPFHEIKANLSQKQPRFR